MFQVPSQELSFYEHRLDTFRFPFGRIPGYLVFPEAGGVVI